MLQRHPLLSLLRWGKNAHSISYFIGFVQANQIFVTDVKVAHHLVVMLYRLPSYVPFLELYVFDYHRVLLLTHLHRVKIS